MISGNRLLATEGTIAMLTWPLRRSAVARKIINCSVEVTDQSLRYGNKVFPFGGGADLSGGALDKF